MYFMYILLFIVVLSSIPTYSYFCSWAVCLFLQKTASPGLHIVILYLFIVISTLGVHIECMNTYWDRCSYSWYSVWTAPESGVHIMYEQLLREVFIRMNSSWEQCSYKVYEHRMNINAQPLSVGQLGLTAICLHWGRHAVSGRYVRY